jgi:type IV secretory pathway VirB6-like protein
LSYSDITRNEMVIMNDLKQLSFTFKLIKYGYFIIRTKQIRVDTVNILKGIIGSPIRIIRKSNVCNDGN